MASIAGERKVSRRRRRRFGFALGGATAAAAAAVLAIFVLSGGGDEAPAQHITFTELPAKMKIGARLEPRPFGTEVHVYVKGVRSGELCRVFLKAKDGTRLSAGSFRYRWGDDSQATLSSGLDLARTEAIGIRVGERTFVAPVGGDDRELTAHWQGGWTRVTKVTYGDRPWIESSGSGVSAGPVRVRARPPIHSPCRIHRKTKPPPRDRSS